MINEKTIPPTFYDKPILGNINLDQLKNLIIERYNLLNAFFEKKEESVMYKHLKFFNWETNLLEDISTHFILALAFCQSESDRTWFINQETKLFQHHFFHFHHFFCGEPTTFPGAVTKTYSSGFLHIFL